MAHHVFSYRKRVECVLAQLLVRAVSIRPACTSIPSFSAHYIHHDDPKLQAQGRYALRLRYHFFVRSPAPSSCDTNPHPRFAAVMLLIFVHVSFLASGLLPDPILSCLL